MVTLTSSANPAGLGDQVTVTATTTPVAPGVGTPTGSIILKDGSATLAILSLAGGEATFSSTMSLGSHPLTAAYNGDADFNPGTSTVFTQVITKASTTLTLSSSKNPSSAGQAISFYAAVTAQVSGGNPTGTVQFQLDGANFGSAVALANGGADSQTTSALTPGTHTIAAFYSGDNSFNSSSDNGTQTVSPPLDVAIAGANTVCPNSTNSFTGPASMDSYAWSVDGAATIVGSSSNQTVSVAAAAGCNTNFVLTLNVVSGASSSTVTQTVAVVDTTAPVITGFPADATYPCADFLAAANDASVTANDDCGGAVTITHNADVITQYSCANRFTVFRAYTATDACGNSSSRTQTITIDDTDGPVFGGVPVDATASCSDVPTAATPVAVDNCEGNPQVTFNETSAPGACAGSYVLTRTWTATDACGNSSVAVQKITVVDTTAPVLGNVPDSITLIAAPAPTPSTLIASDDCDPNPSITLTESESPADDDGVIVLTRTWTASDACGNASSATQTITVVPLIAPHLNCVFVNGELEFSWDAQVGVSYQLQATDNVVDGTWVNVSNAVRASCSPATCCDALNCSSPRFYRVQAAP
jgi:hypothetical protein